MSVYTVIIVLAFLSGMTTLIGAVIATVLKKNVKAITVGLGFAAGIMLWISFFELIPESLHAIGIIKSIIALICGVILIAVLNRVIPHTHLCNKSQKVDSRLLKTAYLCAFGLILHDFPEGFAMANSYLHSPRLGLLIALSIALHNIPEEFAISVPIVLSKKGKRFLFKMAFISGLAEPAGAAIGLLLSSIMPKLTPVFLASAGGMMIFISLHELIPTAKRYGKKSSVFLGLALSLSVYLMLTVLVPE